MKLEKFIPQDKYKEILDTFLGHLNKWDFLTACSKEYLESNPNFFDLLYFEAEERFYPILVEYGNCLTPNNQVTEEEKEELKIRYHLWCEWLEMIDKHRKRDTQANNPEFTTSRQILAIYYLLEYVKVDFSSIDRTDLARFTQFITGKEASNSKISNTTIYKKWGQLFGKSPKKNKQDLIFIKSYFEKLQLSEIVKMIENDTD